MLQQWCLVSYICISHTVNILIEIVLKNYPTTTHARWHFGSWLMTTNLKSKFDKHQMMSNSALLCFQGKFLKVVW